jgi:NPL4 family/NPL4 family, putative zinc binding region
MVYCAETQDKAMDHKNDPSASSSSSKPDTPQKLHRLTRHCQHGPRGRCLYCDALPPDEVSTYKPQCTHAAHVKCPNCDDFVAKGADDDSSDAPATWLCNHPSNAFCPNCIPKFDEDDADNKDDDARTQLCRHAAGQVCVHCLDQGPSHHGVFMPYAYYVAKEKKRSNLFRESPLPNYRGKPNCNRGHLPWPRGVCLACAPENANLKLQKYRHCDYVQFHDLGALRNFYINWVQHGIERQSAAILFGTYEKEPVNDESVGIVTAMVQAVYVPPQESRSTGVRLLRDANEQNAHRVAAALGLQPVGWVICTKPRAGDKYKGKVYMSGAEVRQAARFQARFSNKLGHSKFVTIVMEHGENVAPSAHQVSDQCVAMERDGVLDVPKDPLMLSTVKKKGNELLPTVVYRNHALDPGAEFLPDDLIVKLHVLVAKSPTPMFKYNTFTSSGDLGMLKAQVAPRGSEAYTSKLSDFNMLVNLPRLLGGSDEAILVSIM